MEIDNTLKIEVMQGVYEPAEDTYLLIKSIEVEKGQKVLEMGCGCGVISLHLAKHGCIVVAADINEKSVENTKRNALANGLKIKCIKSDLFSKINDKFRVIIFNPPYLPTSGEDISWDGGAGGTEIIKRFLEEARHYLDENGCIYIVISSLTNFENVKKNFKEKYEFERISMQNLFFEKIYVYRLKPL